MAVIFDFLFIIYFILYLPFLLLRGKWHAGFFQRFGFLSPALELKLSGSRNIWLHAVSVGEAAAMDGVIAGLRRKYPDSRIVLTVTTKAGHSFALLKYGEAADVLWSPVDLSLTVDRFVRVIRPELYIAAETELWPNLFARLSASRVPVVVLNGRISDESFPRYRAVKWLLKSTLRRVTRFGMQSALDARRIIELGAVKSNVNVIGNVKFDNISDPGLIAQQEYGYERDHLVLVAGSTHSGEEELLLDIFQSIRAEHPLFRLVLAPRHPERGARIGEIVRNAGLNPVFFSRNDRVSRQLDVMIVDTIGHLLQFYSLASFVFVGKSLTARGGHNIIEPAMFAKPVIIGPYMQNFKDITQAFLAEKAVIQVDDALALKAEIRKLLQDPQLRRESGSRAMTVIRRNRGAVQRAMDIIEAVRDEKISLGHRCRK